ARRPTCHVAVHAIATVASPNPCSSPLGCRDQTYRDSGRVRASAGCRYLRYALKFSLSPGRGHRAFTSLPVPDRVMYASRMSGPPKQILVVTMSGKATCSCSPVGEKIVMPPL